MLFLTIQAHHSPPFEAPEKLGHMFYFDYVLVFSTNELDRVIQTIRPDVLTKGSNYESEAVMGREIVEKYGGQIELIPITEEVSSTQIINNIKNK